MLHNCIEEKYIEVWTKEAAISDWIANGIVKAIGSKLGKDVTKKILSHEDVPGIILEHGKELAKIYRPEIEGLIDRAGNLAKKEIGFLGNDIKNVVGQTASQFPSLIKNFDDSLFKETVPVKSVFSNLISTRSNPKKIIDYSTTPVQTITNQAQKNIDQRILNLKYSLNNWLGQ